MNTTSDSITSSECTIEIPTNTQWIRRIIWNRCKCRPSWVLYYSLRRCTAQNRVREIAHGYLVDMPLEAAWAIPRGIPTNNKINISSAINSILKKHLTRERVQPKLHARTGKVFPAPNLMVMVDRNNKLCTTQPQLCMYTQGSNTRPRRACWKIVILARYRITTIPGRLGSVYHGYSAEVYFLRLPWLYQ